MTNMRVAIIGGTGQIGLATAECLASMGVETCIVSRRAPDAVPAHVQWLEADVANGESVYACLRQFAPQSIINFAAVLQFACDQTPRAAIDVNIEGALNVLEACRRLNVKRLIFGSSIAVYGERSTLMREDDPIPADANLYALTKLIGERLGEQYRKKCGFEFLALRYSGIFGGVEAATHGMSQVRSKILKTASGEDVVIREASGEELIHLTHVSDAAEATCRALFEPTPSHSIYNVAGPSENYISLRDLHGVVRQAHPKCGDISWNGRAKSAGPVDTTRLSEDLKYFPRRKVGDHVAELISREMSSRLS